MSDPDPDPDLTSHHYRALAIDAGRLAALLNDPAEKTAMTHIASCYERLAMIAEKREAEMTIAFISLSKAED